MLESSAQILKTNFDKTKKTVRRFFYPTVLAIVVGAVTLAVSHFVREKIIRKTPPEEKKP